ncbi:MAG: hypothetical protein Q7R97_03540 [Candidatus Daviesbacteria bacterium]|nr:hypothetical protein [Candidatus Daviesbacteria bacterium]
MIDQEQKLRTEIEEIIDQKLMEIPPFRWSGKSRGFDLPAILVEKWLERPQSHMDIIDILPFQSPARLILTSRDDWEEKIMKKIGFFRRKEIIEKTIDHPAFKSAQIHIKIRNFPDSITLVYYLGLGKNQPGNLTTYRNQPIGDLNEGVFIPVGTKVREATLSDLENFKQFIEQAQPITS